MFFGLPAEMTGFVDLFSAFTLPVGENNQSVKTLYEKMQSYIFMLNYLQDLTYALFKFKGFDVEREGYELDADFCKKTVIDNGKIAFVHTDSGIMHLPIAPERISPYENIVAFSLIGKGSSKNGEIFDNITPRNYTLEQSKEAGDGIGAYEIVYLNPSHAPLYPVMCHFAGLYAMCEQLLINNIFARSLQTIIETQPDHHIDAQAIVDAIFTQNGIMAVEGKGARNVAELLQNNPNAPEWLGDKVVALQTAIVNRYFSYIGINHTPYEKRERLTNEEIKTNDMSLDIIRGSYIDTINEGLARVNKRFDLELSAELTINTTLTGGEENDVVLPTESETTEGE